MTGSVHFRLLASVGLSVAVISFGVPALGPAVAQPMGQTPQSGGANPVVTYRDTGGHVHLVRFSSYAGDAIRPSDTDLSAATAAPPATRTPTGYSSFEGATPVEHVDYRAPGGHVIELWKRQAGDEWTFTDLTDAAHAKATAAGDVVGWGQAYPLQRQWVAYRGSDGDVHALTRAGRTQPWEDIDLSAVAKAGTDADVRPHDVRGRPHVGGQRDPGLPRHRRSRAHPGVGARPRHRRAGVTPTFPLRPDLTSCRSADPTDGPAPSPRRFATSCTWSFERKGGHIVELFGRGSRWKDENLSSNGHTKVLATGDIQGIRGDRRARPGLRDHSVPRRPTASCTACSTAGSPTWSFRLMSGAT